MYNYHPWPHTHMEDTELETLFDPIKHASLSESERVRMRNELSLFMTEHPARAPISVRMREAVQSYSSVFEYISVSYTRPLGAAFALVLVVGIGTSYAAESAMPGDALYAVKVGLNEKLAGALVVSETARADWNTELITRRLAEAETLVAAGALTPVAQAELQTHITTAARDFDASVVALKKSGKDESKAVAAQSKLEASFEAHEGLLATLSVQAPEKSAAVGPIIVKVKTRAAIAEASRVRAGGELAAADARIMKAVATDEPDTRGSAEAEDQAVAMTFSARAFATPTAPTTSATSSDDSDDDSRDGRRGRGFSREDSDDTMISAARVEIVTQSSTSLESEATDRSDDDAEEGEGMFKIYFR